MKTGITNHYCVLLLFYTFITSGITMDALSTYDYSFNSKCLDIPEKPMYNGGMVVNPELKEGLKGWTAFGDAKIETRDDVNTDYSYIVSFGRRQKHDSFSQTFFLTNGDFYTFSGWIQTNQNQNQKQNGSELAAAILKTPTGFRHVGWVHSKAGCWSMLKGGFTANFSGPAHLYFECNNTKAQVWATSISLQQFTPDDWNSHRHQNIEKNRKSRVKIQALDIRGNPLSNATFSINLMKPKFPFGSAMNKNILTNTAYQKWFASRFKFTTFENEMKWYFNEPTQGKEDYSVSDSLIQFTQQHKISVRGHNVLWDAAIYSPEWVNSLSQSQLQWATSKRINSIVTRYSGKVISWDVVNENIHNHFFEDKLGWNTTSAFYNVAHGIDRKAALFLNEYNTIEDPRDSVAAPPNYLAKVKEISAAGFQGPVSIGLEGHFQNLDLAYMRSSLDILASAKLPIWLTELDVISGPKQADFLEEIIKEAFAHPAINGIVMWAAWNPQGCYRMCLTDNNFKNLPTGDVVDRLIWKYFSTEGFKGTTDSQGYFEVPLIHGDYQVTVSHPNFVGPSWAHSFPVTSLGDSQDHLRVRIVI